MNPRFEQPTIETSAGRARRLALRAVVVAYAVALLSIHINHRWRLIHEDNGAMQTTLALSHTRYGLAATRAHNVFIDPRTGAKLFYVRHPAAVPLVIAVAFTLTGSDAPWVARSVMVAFSVVTMLVMMSVLSELFADETLVLAGGLAMATFPMESFFGRMVNYEAPALLFGLVQIDAYVRHRRTRGTASLGILIAAIVIGGLFDWSSLLFSGAIVIAALVDRLRGRRSAVLLASVLSAALVTSLNLAHVMFATGSLHGFVEALTTNVGVGHDPLTIGEFAALQLDNFRGYFTMSGLIATVLVTIALLLPHSRVAATLLPSNERDVRRFLAINLGAAVAWLLASPNRARLHHYWQFYFLPYVVIAFVLLIRWLLRKQRAGAVVLILIAMEVVTSSAYKLYRRHTRESEWAIESIRATESNYLQARDPGD